MNHIKSWRRVAIALILVMTMATSTMAAPPAQGGDAGIGGFMNSLGKKLCLVYVALGSTAAIATLNTIWAMMTELSPPDFPKALPVILCQVCDICLDNECFKTSQPIEPKAILTSAGGGSGAAIEALSREGGWKPAEGLPGRGISPLNDSRAYILNTALTTTNAAGRNEAAPNLVDFLNIRTEVYEARVDIDQGLPADFYEPQDMALTDDESMLVVVSRGADRQFFPNGILPHLTLIDTQSAQVLRRINLAVEDYPSSLVLSPDGRLAYVSAAQKAGGQGVVVGAQLVVADLQTNQVVDRLVLPFTGGLGAGEIVITPDGGLLVLILNDGQFGNSSVLKLAFIDTATLTISATFPTPDTPFNTSRMIGNPKNLAMDPSGSKVYMAEARASFEDDTQGIAVIDVATALMTEVISMPGTRSGGDPDVQMAANGQLIVETNARTGMVTVVDALTHEIRDQEKIYDTFFNSALSEGP